jgi:hypothetical protein
MAIVAMAKYGHAYHHKSSKKTAKEKLIRIQLDSGSDGDLLFHQKGKPKHLLYLTRQVPCSWHTLNGVFHTKGRGKLLIRVFEYSISKEFLVEPNVFEYDQKMSKPVFDLIIGCNSMEKLGIVMNFKAKSITIDKIILPMRNIANLKNKTKVKEAWGISNAIAHEPISTELATQRAVKILDANCKKADLQAVVTNCTQLNSIEKNKLLGLLKKFEPLFDGTLGHWRTNPVSFQLKDGVNPNPWQGAFPIPKVHKDVVMKEIHRLCDLGVLEWQSSSEWAAPLFIQPKKNKTVCF